MGGGGGWAGGGGGPGSSAEANRPVDDNRRGSVAAPRRVHRAGTAPGRPAAAERRRGESRGRVLRKGVQVRLWSALDL